MAASRSVRFASIAAALTVGALLVAAYAGNPAVAERGRVAAADLQAAAPADVGLSADRLDQLAAGIQAMVDDGKLAGAVTLLARHGRIAFADTAGVQDIATGRPLQRDTIFRIYSMTKPITGVALMLLLNEGELDGARLLAPQTVELMRSNHLSPQALATMRPGQGFGLDFAVALDPAQAREPYATGSYYWGGAAGTWFWIDPLTDLTFVGMIQHLGPAVREVQALSRRFAYEAVVN